MDRIIMDMASDLLGVSTMCFRPTEQLQYENLNFFINSGNSYPF